MIRAMRGEMPDTATFGWRKWLWVPTPAVGGDGILSISQRPISSLADENVMAP